MSFDSQVNPQSEKTPPKGEPLVGFGVRRAERYKDFPVLVYDADSGSGIIHEAIILRHAKPSYSELGDSWLIKFEKSGRTQFIPAEMIFPRNESEEGK
ncbi:hypothetical protein H6G00_01930 [Leptolyngbya sp. FACHB-541]|uniref:hypothetical protein n=1 Tax=Leptolyngbya sp. FACHB-541 TaxID=2692810 RepID=UPI0016872B95|nr:hypothetical protein [Leptolyngbya sp. FACHB-541]MBD1995391.1 hypothetical protein [Leptolyngbya sp. FACHB-541]